MNSKLHARNKVVVRRAKAKDVARLAELSGQLGYSATADEIRTRFGKLRRSSADAVFVGQSGNEMIGWVHVSVCHLLELPTRGEINAFIVADGQRSKGAGAQLLEAAEDWARRKKCEHMSVRCNVIREAAHAFYERHGFEHYKTQKAFRKRLQ